MDYKRKAHSVYLMTYHIVFVTKYRKPILSEEIGDFVNPPRPNASVMDEASHRIRPKMSQIDEVPDCCFRQHGISDYGYSLSSATWSRGRSVTCL